MANMESDGRKMVGFVGRRRSPDHKRVSAIGTMRLVTDTLTVPERGNQSGRK